MDKADLARAKRIEYECPDGDCLLFSTKSWTRPGQGLRHHLVADFKDGIITCNCEDGRIHKKWIEILTGKGNPCKHILACHKLCKRILESKE